MRADEAVTVVIPTKDRLTLVKRSLASAVSQIDVNVRVIVIDDGGRPDGWAAIAAFQSPSVVAVRHHVSQGVSEARNTGLSMVQTPWVAFLDDDDLWAPDKLSIQLAAITDCPTARWSCVGAVHLDTNLRPFFWQPPPPSDRVLSTLRRSGGIPGGGSGVLVSTELARQVGGFDSSFSILADWDFYYRLGLAASVVSVDRPLVGYYRHRDSLFNDVERLAAELIDLDRKYQSSFSPLELDFAEWVVQLFVMSLRAKRLKAVQAFGRNEVANRARTARVVVHLLRRLFRWARAGERPSGWLAEDLTWIGKPC